MSMDKFFSSVVGHRSAVEQLQKLVERKSLPHALLFSGPEAVGKKRVAQALAGCLLTNGGQDEKTDEKLRLLELGNHPDFHLCTKAEEKKDISVESIRDLCSAIRLKPYYANCRISIIDNAHLMNIAASNALLMTLEEPCDESYLILVTHAAQRLPATILSRCQTLNFGELLSADVEVVLRERWQLPPALLALVKPLCAGGFDALEIERFLSPDGLRVVDADGLFQYLQELSTHAKKVRAEIAEHIGSELTSAAITSFAAFLATEVDETPIVWRILHESLRDAMRSAKRSDVTRLAQLLELSLSAEKLVRERNVNPQLQLTSLLLEQLR